MLNPNSEGVSLFRLRWIGYGLLIFSVLDSLDTLIPLQLMNPDWIRQTFGALVERTPLLLMGLGLIFNGEGYRRRKIETFFLKVISWGCLLLMLLFALLIPLGLTVSSFRVYNQNQQLVNTRLQQNLRQLQQTQEQVGRASESELKDLVEQLRRNAQQSGQPAPDLDVQSPTSFRQQLLTQLKVRKTQVEDQAATFLSAQQRTLTKDALKWSLGSLIVSVLCLMFWQSSASIRNAKVEPAMPNTKRKPRRANRSRNERSADNQPET
jgi:hypothetical protein